MIPLKFYLKQNDVLINSTGTGTLGRVCLVEKNPNPSTFADGHVTIVRSKIELLEAKFLFSFLSILQATLTAICSEGSTNQIELSRFELGNFWIPLPPLDEQRAIVAHLERVLKEMDELKVALLDSLVLLNKRRAALIAHSVTGC